jgi:hypothetical protein
MRGVVVSGHRFRPCKKEATLHNRSFFVRVLWIRSTRLFEVGLSVTEWIRWIERVCFSESKTWPKVPFLQLPRPVRVVQQLGNTSFTESGLSTSLNFTQIPSGQTVSFQAPSQTSRPVKQTNDTYCRKAWLSELYRQASTLKRATDTWIHDWGQ